MDSISPTWTNHWELRELPRLSVPSLEDTLKRFLEYVEPLVDEEEFERTKHVIKSFSLDQAPKLDYELRQLEKTAKTSWLEPFWDESYLEIRYPIPINVNPAFLFSQSPLLDGSKPKHQTQRAALLLEGTAQFIYDLRSLTLKPDLMSRQKPLCMHQYTKLFGATRIPQVGCDRMEFNYSCRHIIVIAHSQYYVLDIFDKLSNEGQIPQPISSCILERELEAILQDARSKAESQFSGGSVRDNQLNCVITDVGMMTTLPRDTWAKSYGQLTRLNAMNIEKINSAILVLVLDDSLPVNVDQAIVSLLHNYGKSRWFDKSIQLIVFSNAMAGVNMEHTGFDGTALIRWIQDIQQHLDKKLSTLLSESAASSTLLQTDEVVSEEEDARGEPYSNPSSLQKAPNESSIAFGDLICKGTFEKLSWHLDQQTRDCIDLAAKQFYQLASKLQNCSLSFQLFGVEFIVSHQLSPDSFFQLALHTAYFRTFGQLKSAYEACNMRHYYHGRTECLRSLTKELAEFVSIANDPLSTSDIQIEVARLAMKAHVNRAKECQSGNGVDRHLWGMLQIAKRLNQRFGDTAPIPEFYSLSTWKRLQQDDLSTSNCGNTSINTFAFSPTSPNGLGVGYVISKFGISAHITSFKNEARILAHNLDKTLMELGRLFREQVPIRLYQRSKI